MREYWAIKLELPYTNHTYVCTLKPELLYINHTYVCTLKLELLYINPIYAYKTFSCKLGRLVYYELHNGHWLVGCTWKGHSPVSFCCTGQPQQAHSLNTILSFGFFFNSLSSRLRSEWEA